MNASMIGCSRLVGSLAVVALTMTLAACDKKGDSAAPAGSTSTTTAAAGKAKTTRKLSDIKAAYAAELEDMKKMNDPMDKKVGAFMAKVGKPDSEEGTKHVWWALDGDKCSKVTLDPKSGGMTEETTDKSNCGM